MCDSVDRIRHDTALAIPTLLRTPAAGAHNYRIAVYATTGGGSPSHPQSASVSQRAIYVNEYKR